MLDGQGSQVLQQVMDLMSQLAQTDTEPQIQRAINGVMTQLQPLMGLVAQDDQQDMQSGLATPGGAMPPGGPGGGPPAVALGAGPDLSGGVPGGPGLPGMPPGGGGGPPDMGGNISSETGPGLGIPGIGRGAPGEKTFKGARAAAMNNFRSKGTFSKSGATETERSRNRREGGRSLKNQGSKK